MIDYNQLKLDFRRKEPLFEQLAALLRREMELGQIQPGEQLPTVRVLAGLLGINFNTVARAYRVLDAEGRISTQQGRGTFVTDPIETQEPSDEGSFSTERFVDHTLTQAAKLGIQPEDLYRHLWQKLNAFDDPQTLPRRTRTGRVTRYMRSPQRRSELSLSTQVMKKAINVLRKRR